MIDLTAAPLPMPFVDRRCADRACARQNAYRMVGGCYNCGTSPILGLFSASHQHNNGGQCPVCGCRRLHWDRLATPDETPVEGRES